MKKGWYWPWIVAALLVATAAGQGILFYAATHDASMAIEPDYYRKAVAWDAQRARDSVSAALGWTATGELRAPDSTGAEVAVRLADADGAPLGGARVRVTAIHNLEGARRVEGALPERATGTYAAKLPLRRAGLWELRIDAHRGRDHFTATVRTDAPRDAR